jgi:hypothetical protein
MSRPKSGSGERSFGQTLEGTSGEAEFVIPGPRGTYFKGVPRVLSTFWV